MPETPASFSHLDSPAANGILPQGCHILRGWVWPRAGGLFTDIRARVGARIFPGVHGLPRADLAAHFRIGQKYALAEFSVVVELSPGTSEVALEALEIEGHWTLFQTVTFHIIAANPPATVAVPPGALRWIDYCHGLQRLLRGAGHEPDEGLAGLAANLAAEMPFPRELRQPPAPLLGFVDEPAMVCCNRFGRIPAFGHLFHPELRIRRMYGSVDLQALQPLPYGQPSPGPAAHYAQIRHARDCGFLGFVDVPAQLPNPASLRIYAELEDDSLHLCQVVRTRLHTAEEEKSPYPVYQPDLFDRALRNWDQALTTRGLPVERGPELDRSLASLRDEYERRAPRHAVGAVSPLVESKLLPPASPPPRIILATHGLSLQGAPRFLLEYARYLATAGVRLHVISAEEGPLRRDFQALGARVTVVDTGPVFAADSLPAMGATLASLTSAVNWTATDLVVANSFTAFWAVHAAKTAGRPVLMYVHESTTPASFYGQRVSHAVVAAVEEAFALTDCVSFTTASTRRYHLDYGRPERHRLTPGWVDLAGLDHWRAGQDREALRKKFGLQPGELLVCNIGTVSDRKGQHTFARAVDLLWRRDPALAGRTRFVLLGGRETPFDRMLTDLLAALNRPNLVVQAETPDYLPYYLAADAFACSSYEESSPRVIFEAMALQVPIIASAVHGIPELVRPDREALLLPAGDTNAWCGGLARLLASPALRHDLTRSSRARAESHFNAPAVLALHGTLARAVTAGTI